MKTVVLSLLCVGLSGGPMVVRVAGADTTALPAYSVRPEFTLRVSAPPNSNDNKIIFLSVDDTAPARWHGFVRFRSATVKTGDLVVSINGKPVAEMKPGEARRLMHTAPGDKLVVEVRQPKEKGLRRAVATRIPTTEADAK
ncbi:MAG: PDZ domain-containing protein [Verrucomicrobiota bacterium]